MKERSINQWKMGYNIIEQASDQKNTLLKFEIVEIIFLVVITKPKYNSVNNKFSRDDFEGESERERGGRGWGGELS